MQKLILGALVVLACVCLIQVNGNSVMTNSTATVHGPAPTTSTDHGMMTSSHSGDHGKGDTPTTPTSGAGTVKAVAGVLVPIFVFALS